MNTRVDLHMHSSASVTTGDWFSQFFGCPESYASPERQYALCKARGMTLVTLTDHDTIEGGLSLMDREDFFLSEEVSAIFPENGCVMHILVWNFQPFHHTELQERRGNIYELSAYLRQQNLAHGLAHPLLSPNWKLDSELLEKCLVLFPCLERMNGLFDRRLDADLEHLLAHVTPDLLVRLAKKHGLPLPEGGARRPSLTAGSDDHGHRRCGTSYTEVEGNVTATKFFEHVMRGQTSLVGTPGDLNAMTMSINDTALEHLRQRSEYRNSKRDLFFDFASILGGRETRPDAAPSPDASILKESVLWAASQARIPVGPEYDLLTIPIEGGDAQAEKVVSAISQVSDKLFSRAIGELAIAVADWDIFRLFAALREFGTALTASAPVLFAANDFGNQRAQVERIWQNWTAFPAAKRAEHLAVFSDSTKSIDGGVATWCGRFGIQANRSNRQVWFPCCSEDASGDEVACPENALPAVSRFAIPFYDGFELTVPSLTATIDRMWRMGITHVELSTPGPMGLVGLVAARLLGLPVTSSYHTDLPDQLRSITGHASIGRATGRYLSFFYRFVDRVFCFSSASRDKLIAMGVAASRIELMPMAVDPDDFAPNHSSPTAFAAHGLDTQNRPVVLSVGRVSEEKNIPAIVDAVTALRSREPAPLLVVVGDGPILESLKRRYADNASVAFLGFQGGESLRRLYASASVFAFASQVDTFGLVNLEALSSGVPVVVPANSAIAEFLKDGDTALFYKDDQEGLAEAIRLLLDHPNLALRLSTRGRRYAVEGWEAGHFERVWEKMLRPASTQASQVAQPQV